MRVLDERLPKELAEFLTVKKVQEGEGQGRQSGSLAWRLNRGETTSGQAQAAETEVCRIHLIANLYLWVEGVAKLELCRQCSSFRA